jgi:uncharacterized membrane protein YbhN (UPF0104 family)
MFIRILISVSVSALILYFLFHLADAPSGEENIWNILQKTSHLFMIAFLVCTLCQAVARTVRYQWLLKACGETSLPSFKPLLLVTLTRNMFADLFPARLGELSYVAMLNRGCGVRSENCLASLSISILFDLIALIVIVWGILIFQIISGGLEGWILSSAIGIAIFIAFAALILFYGLPVFTRGLRRIFKYHLAKTPVLKMIELVEKTAAAIQKTKEAGIFTKVIFLSLILRFFKYSGFYAGFLAVTIPNFPELAEASWTSVLMTLFSAEASSSLPIPSFMSFGTYETGGLLILKGLGFSVSHAAKAMLAVHIYSQVIDYTIGLTAFLAFMYLGIRTGNEKSVHEGRKN